LHPPVPKGGRRYTEPPQRRHIDANGALFAQSGGGNVNGSTDRFIATSLSGSENALPLRSRSPAKQNVMLEFRPRNACYKADSLCSFRVSWARPDCRRGDNTTRHRFGRLDRLAVASIFSECVNFVVC